jgi:hypothetical protein
MLSSSSFSDLFVRVDALSHLAEAGTSLLKEIQDNEQIARIKGLLAQSSANEARAAADALAQQKAELDALMAKEQDLIARLDASAAAASKEITDADSQGAALAQRIADLRIAELDQTILAAEQAAWDEANYYMQHHLGGLPTPAPSQPTGTYRFDWPAPGSFISQWYGPSTIPQEPAMFGRRHREHPGVRQPHHHRPRRAHPDAVRPPAEDRRQGRRQRQPGTADRSDGHVRQLHRSPSALRASHRQRAQRPQALPPGAAHRCVGTATAPDSVGAGGSACTTRRRRRGPSQ